MLRANRFARRGGGQPPASGAKASSLDLPTGYFAGLFRFSAPSQCERMRTPTRTRVGREARLEACGLHHGHGRDRPEIFEGHGKPPPAIELGPSKGARLRHGSCAATPARRDATPQTTAFCFAARRNHSALSFGVRWSVSKST